MHLDVEDKIDYMRGNDLRNEFQKPFGVVAINKFYGFKMKTTELRAVGNVNFTAEPFCQYKSA